MGIRNSSRLIVDAQHIPAAESLNLEHRILEYSALRPKEFIALFEGHYHANEEMDAVLRALEHVREHPGEKFVPEDHRADENFKLHLMVGLPRSGKSTTVKNLGYAIMNPDTIRLVYHGKRFLATAEPEVWDVAERVVDNLREAGLGNVIIDATNTNGARRDFWLRNYSGELHILRTPVETCVERAFATDQEDLVPVIKAMAAGWDLDDTYAHIEDEAPETEL
jgi:predicted kinase